MSSMEEISMAIAWHGRLMVLAWVILVPTSVIVTRFFKVLPWQKWPTELDNRTWWHTHLCLQYAAVVATLLALCLILLDTNDLLRHSNWHRAFGWITVILCCLQVLSGLLRGSKGGPTDRRSLSGDHYDMTRRRRLFETVHKSNGYLVLLVASISVQTGLLASHAPPWMSLLIIIWSIGVVVVFVTLQNRGFKVDTYQAIWGHAASQQKSRNSLE